MVADSVKCFKFLCLLWASVFLAVGNSEKQVHLPIEGEGAVKLIRYQTDVSENQITGHKFIGLPARSKRDVWRHESALDSFDIPESKINETIEANPEGKYVTASDDHKYYTNHTVDYHKVWIDLDDFNITSGAVKEHQMLSKSYRRAATVSLSFAFPFYGHEVRNVTIATGGFLYTGNYVHSWLAATQYIAPLMANFDMSLNDSARIRYADNGSIFVVEWENVYLQDQENNGSGSAPQGPFTFQAILHDNGDIYFAYKSVPLLISSIEDGDHPVKVGLSDAYIIDRTIFFVRRKTIYEYHRISLIDYEIGNETAIYFKALSTCNRKKTCRTCLTDRDSDELKCEWCPTLQICSDGVDRNRQLWIKKGCDKQNLNRTQVNMCGHYDSMIPNENVESRGGSLTGDATHEAPSYIQTDSDSSEEGDGDLTKNTHVHVGVATLIVIGFIILSGFLWFGYAYFFPHTWSGQLLIKYRPSRWQWLRGEPRYTAASIHM